MAKAKKTPKIKFRRPPSGWRKNVDIKFVGRGKNRGVLVRNAGRPVKRKAGKLKKKKGKKR